MRAATPAQDVKDLLAAVEREPGVPLVLADGVRLATGIALYDKETNTVYLSSRSLAGQLGSEGNCPSASAIRRLALGTVGIFVHEVSHSQEREEWVRTTEGELLAYAREARFLAGLKGWPPKAVRLEVERRRKLDEAISRHEEVLEKVAAMQYEEPSKASLDKLQEYVHFLDKSKKTIQALQSAKPLAHRTEALMAEMVDAWRQGWPHFKRFSKNAIVGSPSLADRPINLERAKVYLGTMKTAIAEEPKGTLGYEVLERGTRLGEHDVRFWSDEAEVKRASDFFSSRLREVRRGPVDRASR